MEENDFIFLEEYSDSELYVFLNKCREKVLKFIWKDVEIIGKYIGQEESNYNTELWLETPFDLLEIGFDSVAYKVLSKIDENYLEDIDIGFWYDKELYTEISIYNYPDEIRNLDDETIWTKENIQKEHKDIIDKVKKDLEHQKKMGKEFFKYSDELEIIKRENLSKDRRKEELMKKIVERVEAGERYALYRKRLDAHLGYMKKYLRDNKYIY